ncbi:MAG: fibrobacter succinogenes major paralogous domain-containing protein [Flavobacteriales bacterium]|nr:fibrobacter succinogenes major paralogous domain-containing protein [Flavobacteriales bacterium]
MKLFFIIIGMGFYKLVIAQFSDMDGKLYPVVRIGNQIWITRNLEVSKFLNGDPIPEARTDEEWKRMGEERKPAWCYYNNDTAMGRLYGKLYNWYAVNDPRGLVPSGWRIPSMADWEKLIKQLGGLDIAGLKLKSDSGWHSNGIGDNSSGFNALPGGYRSGEGIFYDFKRNGYWWATTVSVTFDAWGFRLFYDQSSPVIGYSSKMNGYSVRCLMNYRND